MEIRIRWKAAARSRAVEEHLARRLAFALGRFDGRLKVVRAWLEDVNGPRGGRDKRCALEIAGRALHLRAEALDVDFYAAIDRAAAAAARALERRRERAPRLARIASSPPSRSSDGERAPADDALRSASDP